MWKSLCLVVALHGSIGLDTAEAGRKFALVTWGETITEVDPITIAATAPISGKQPKVGYHYNHVGLFWLDLWSWDGNYCLYSGDQYQPIDEKVASGLLGHEASKPLEYRFPPLLILLIGFVIFRVVRTRFQSS